MKQVARLLLQNGANPNLERPGWGYTLPMASRNKNLNLEKVYLEHGASVDGQDKCGHTALHEAVKENDVDIIREFYSCLANEFGRQVLHMVDNRSGSEVAIIDALLDNGAYISAP